MQKASVLQLPQANCQHKSSSCNRLNQSFSFNLSNYNINHHQTQLIKIISTHSNLIQIQKQKLSVIKMHIDLFKRIRQKLNINPSSRSTVVKKQQLIRYAMLLYEENQKLNLLLEPKKNTILQNTERILAQKEITLMAYESQLKKQLERKASLQNTIRYYTQFIQTSKIEKSKELQKIRILKSGLQNELKQQVQLQQFQIIIEKDIMVGEEKQGEFAMLTFMKQFVELAQHPKNP